MKQFLVFSGLVFLLKGGIACLHLAEGFSVSNIASAYDAGLVTGHALAALAFLVGGVGLIKRGVSIIRARPPGA